MKLSILTDGLTTDFEEMLDIVAGFGYQALELATGNWSDAPHVDLDGLLSSKKARTSFMDSIKKRGLYICALNCSGNQLAPNEKGKKHAETVIKTFKLAEMLGIKKLL